MKGKKGFQKGHPAYSGVFRKGLDKRRNTNGQRNKESVAFTRTLRSILVEVGEEMKTVRNEENRIIGRKKNVEWLGRIVWQEALKGKEFFVSFIADRVEGKITQSLDLNNTGSVDHKLIIEVIKTKE